MWTSGFPGLKKQHWTFVLCKRFDCVGLVNTQLDKDALQDGRRRRNVQILATVGQPKVVGGFAQTSPTLFNTEGLRSEQSAAVVMVVTAEHSITALQCSMVCSRDTEIAGSILQLCLHRSLPWKLLWQASGPWKPHVTWFILLLMHMCASVEVQRQRLSLLAQQTWDIYLQMAVFCL